MRVVIISWDGLEYDLVEKYNCLNLMQEEYGRVDLEPYFESRFGGVASRNPLTTEVYAVTLTGILPSKLAPFNSNPEWVQKLSAGYKTAYPTFLNVEGSFAVDVPTYSDDKSWIHKLLGQPLFKRFWENKISLGTVETEYYRYMKMKAEMLPLILRFGYGMVMLYFKGTDHMGHIFRGERFAENRERMYRYADYLTGRMIGASRDSFVLVHSDHGLNERGAHTSYGFWSVNRPLGRESVQLQEWYKIIGDKYGETAGGLSKDLYSAEEKEELVGRLREMGYLG